MLKKRFQNKSGAQRAAQLGGQLDRALARRLSEVGDVPARESRDARNRVRRRARPKDETHRAAVGSRAGSGLDRREAEAQANAEAEAETQID